MKRWRWLLALALVGLIVAAAYFTGTSQQARTEAAKPNESAAAYDYEANTVTVRQMDESGRLQYQIEAEHVTQLPQNGAVMASKLTMHYDPAGSANDETRRWKLTADSAQLPQNSELVTLQGHVVVRGRPSPTAGTMTFTFDNVDYNLKTQYLSTKERFAVDWPGGRVSGVGLLANIKQGTIEKVESETNGQILP